MRPRPSPPGTSTAPPGSGWQLARGWSGLSSIDWADLWNPAALAAFFQTLVKAYGELCDAGRGVPTHHRTLNAENRWLAARHTREAPANRELEGILAASLTVVAACLVLGGSEVELATAGSGGRSRARREVDDLFVLPVLAWLVLQRGRRAVAVAVGGGAAGLLLVGMWGYVLNLVHTGHVLGRGGGRTENTTFPTFPGSLTTALRLVYRTLDLSPSSRGSSSSRPR